MKLTRGLVSLTIIFSLGFISLFSFATITASADDNTLALQRGYRTGYSDGYMAGYRDSLDGVVKSYVRHAEYDKANRAYNKEYGDVEDYRDGYRQGFESGYDTGFTKQPFVSTVPANLTLRGRSETAKVADAPITEPAPIEVAPSSTQTTVEIPVVEERATPAQAAIESTETTVPSPEPVAAAPQADVVRETSTNAYTSPDEVIVLPRDTELILELQDAISTDGAKEGDKFTARVVSPAEVSGAMIEGRVEKIQKPGRIKRRSQMLLSFDRIIVSEARWSNFDAILTEVLPVKGDNVRRVDAEGSAIGKSSLKGDTVKVGAATGTGAGIGAIAGGPVGAAVGAGVGAAIGVGAVAIEHGKHINLNRNQQLRIKSSYETKIR